MNDTFLPTQYHLEVYENTFINDPSYHLQSSTPFIGLSVGDHFNHRAHDGWHERPNTETEKFRIKEIEHIFWSIDDSHNGHKVMVLLEKVPYTW